MKAIEVGFSNFMPAKITTYRLKITHRGSIASRAAL
jgi:hypothetical protein